VVDWRVLALIDGEKARRKIDSQCFGRCDSAVHGVREARCGGARYKDIPIGVKSAFKMATESDWRTEGSLELARAFRTTGGCDQVSLPTIPWLEDALRLCLLGLSKEIRGSSWSTILFESVCSEICHFGCIFER